MNLEKTPYSILNKQRGQFDYSKGIYKKKFQVDNETYKYQEAEDKRDTIHAQDVLMLERISI